MNEQDLTKDLGNILEYYSGINLTSKIAKIESSLKDKNSGVIKNFVSSDPSVNINILNSAFKIKNVAGQINVIIHSLGILNALPFILEVDEAIEYLSLGAGNTGKHFDLSTNKRIAEFKFIDWKGNDTIRQNNAFIDFFNLAECETEKNKYIYLTGKKQFLKFLNNSRSLSSVLSKNRKTSDNFFIKYDNKYKIVSEYYNHKKSEVNICDLYDVAPEMFSK